MIQYITGHTYQFIDFLSCWAAAVPFALQKWDFFLQNGVGKVDVSPGTGGCRELLSALDMGVLIGSS